jgi:phosphotransferase system  glucose/maltose/N-acetylglucosamine-specific IIC component
MKVKFLLLTFLLLFSRGCDFYSTSLWFFQPGGMEGETNPLTRFLGVGWSGLIITNVIIVGLIIFAFYYYTFKYATKKTESIPIKLTDYISELYFNEKGRFYQVFYRTPKNKKVLLAHSGYVLVRVLIIGSFLATIHNLCQFYNIPIYNTYREIVGRPLFVIYGLILASAGYFIFRLWNKEFELAKRTGS